jgi:hypothetical protein
MEQYLKRPSLWIRLKVAILTWWYKHSKRQQARYRGVLLSDQIKPLSDSDIPNPPTVTLHDQDSGTHTR